MIRAGLSVTDKCSLGRINRYRRELATNNCISVLNIGVIYCLYVWRFCNRAMNIIKVIVTALNVDVIGRGRSGGSDLRVPY